jgi:hypothetical protein
MINIKTNTLQYILVFLFVVLIYSVALLFYFNNPIDKEDIKPLEAENFPIEENGMRCYEKWEDGELIERVCRAKDVFDYTTKIEFDSKSGLAGTGSMLPAFEKGDVMYYHNVEEDDFLMEGSVYVYDKLNRTSNETYGIIHRLAGSYLDGNGEEYLIFKGDNNPGIDDPVPRNDVTRLLIGVCFEEGRDLGLC